MNNLPIESLDFDGIKTNLKNYIRSTGKFNDIDIESSGISTIINLLAYNTHYIGYYTKMLLNESFIDSAILRSTLLSKAKLTGYTPKSKRAAKATVKITAFLSQQEKDSLLNSKVIIPQFNTFIANTESGEKQFFNQEIGEFVLISQNGALFKYESQNITLYEGNIIEEKFVVSNNNTTRYVIYNTNIDTDFLKVYVKNNINSSVQKEYTRTDTLYSINNESEIYFLTTNESGYYELIFGNDVFGKKLELNNQVIIKYLSTSAAAGNSASQFKTAGASLTANTYSNFNSHIITTIEKSSGGMAEESIQELKRNIPRYNARQFRLVTTEDYKSFIMNEYRDISSINVFSGENAIPKEFNKIFITIKPINTRLLSEFAKKEILEKVNRLKHIGTIVVFKDPKFIDIDLIVNIKLKSDNIKNHNILKQEFLNIIQDYNKNYLNKFSNSYSDIEILSRIKKDSQSIEAIYTDKIINIDIQILHDDINEIVIPLGLNKIKPDTISSSDILFNGKRYKITEDTGKLYLIESGEIYSQEVGEIDYKNNLIKIRPLITFRSDIVYTNYSSYKIKFDTLATDVFSFNDYLVNIQSAEIVIL